MSFKDLSCLSERARGSLGESQALRPFDGFKFLSTPKAADFSCLLAVAAVSDRRLMSSFYEASMTRI
jgi:hypothetical protein